MNENVVVFVVSTTGQGDPPDNMKVRCNNYHEWIVKLVQTILNSKCTLCTFTIHKVMIELEFGDNKL